jgi:hypothetical protein
MGSAFSRWLSKPTAPRTIVALALLLCAPALTTGLTGDDYYQKLVLTGGGDIAAIPKDPQQLFSWASGDPVRAHAMMEVGMTGWWTDPTLVMAYFRPLSVATHHLDYRLWPEQPWLMHAHSLLWFALALGMLGRVYQRLLVPARAAWLPVLALLVFAVDDAHAMTIAWIANRNALVAFTLAMPVLLLHDRAVRDNDRRSGRVAPLLLLVALLAGESALAVTGYLFAYALFIDPAPRTSALRRLLPYAGVAAVWSLGYRALGFGARGSGLVVDPGSEPLRFLGKAAERVPVMLAAQFGFPPSDAWEAYPVLRSWLPVVMMAWALLTLAVVLIALWPRLMTQPSARFFALGLVLAALPVAAQFPHDRLLFFIGLGAAPLIAMLIGDLFAPAASADTTRLGVRGQRIVTWACAALHLGIAPLWLPLRVRAPLDIERMVGAADRSIDDRPAVRDKTVVLVNPPVDAFAGYVPPMRAAQGRNRPHALRWLATGGSDVQVQRVAVSTLRVRPKFGFLALSSERMQRNPENRMPLGYQVRFSDLTIEVTALTQDGRPAEILARFDRPLEDPHFVFLAWHGRRFVPFKLPTTGRSVVLPRVDFTTLLP